MGAARTRNVKRVYMKGKMVIECDGSSSSRSAFDDGGCGEGGGSCRTMAAAGVDDGCSTSSSALIVHPNYRHTLPRKGVDDARRALQTEGTGSENRTDFLSLIPQEIIVKIFSTAILSHTDMCALAMTSPYISSIAESDEIQRLFWARECTRQFSVDTSSPPPPNSTWKDVFRFNHSILHDILLNDKALKETLERAYPVYQRIAVAS